MQSGQPSTTAERAALLRAAHQLFDQPRVLEDPIVMRLLAPERTAELSANPQAFERPALRNLRASIALRSRYAEDSLAEAVRRGVRQYVILGAGLDSFAYRNPFPADLRVYEVDHPATQAWKRARLQAAGIEEPEPLRFIPFDFERQPLLEALTAGGLDLHAPAFVSWLGVTVYLTREAVLGTLKALRSLAPGSEVVFSYLISSELMNERAQAAVSAIAARAAGSGEPWLTHFDPAELSGALTDLGFVQIEDFGGEQAVERYFRDRSDGLHPGGSGHLMRARVPA